MTKRVVWRLEPVMDGFTIPLKSQIRSSDVLLDSALSLDAQVSAVPMSAFAELKLVYQLRPFLEMSNPCDT